MMIKAIEYQGFRNLINGRLEFARDFNFITGENGAGKTNLLEMIYYAGMASSFRAREERRLICFGEDHLRIDASSKNRQGTIYLDHTRKRLSLQGNEISRVTDFVGWLGVVILSIDDIWIIRGSPGRRRYFLDWAVARISPSYLGNLIAYRKVLKQRNRALQLFENNGNVRVLDALDEELIKYGNRIYEVRKDKLVALREYYNEIANRMGLKKFDFSYRCSADDMKLDTSQLERIRKREIALGQSLIGPHRDDLYFTIDGRAMQYYASEGEERVAAISLKLAEAEMYYRLKQERPVLLLDEVGAELDNFKKGLLLEQLKGQVFYASTQMPGFNGIYQDRDLSFFIIKGGVIEVSPAH